MFSRSSITVIFLSAMSFSIEARLNLLRIAHWQNQKQHTKEGQLSQEDLEAASHNLASIAMKLHSANRHVEYLGQAEDDEDENVLFNADMDRAEWDYRSGQELPMEVERREDAHRAFLERYDVAYKRSLTGHNFLMGNDNALSYSMSFHNNKYPTSVPQSILDEFPDLTSDFSMSFAPAWPIGDITNSPVIAIPTQAPSIALVSRPTSTLPTSSTPISSPVSTGQEEGPSPPSNNESNGQGNDDSNAGSTPSFAPAPPSAASPISSSGGGTQPPVTVAGAEEQEEDNSSINSDDVEQDEAKLPMIGVLVGAVGAIAAAFAIRKWHHRGHQGTSAAVPLMKDGESVSNTSTDMA